MFVEGALICVAAVLLYSGFAKLVSPTSARTMIAELGVPQSLAAPLGVLLALGEIAAAGLVVLSRGIVGATALAVLGTLFALTGTLALLSHRRVACYCFGRVGSHKPLGWRQILALPIWLGAAVLVGVLADQDPTSLEARLVVAWLGAGLAALVFSAQVVPEWLSNRSLRLSRRPRL